MRRRLERTALGLALAVWRRLACAARVAAAGNLGLADQHLAAEARVDPRRIGMLGFSAGASLAFLAATDPSIRDELRELVWLGGYYDADELADEIEARRFDDVTWEPHPLT